MMRLIFGFFVVIGMLSLQGCSKADIGRSVSGQPGDRQLQLRIDGVDKQIEREHYRNEEFRINVQNQMVQLLNRMSSLEKFIYRYKSIIVDPRVKGFQRLDTATGFFLVACEAIVPEGNGYKLTFIVSNPSAVTYNGYMMRVTWGKEYEGTSPAEFAEWQKSLKEKERLFASNVLTPGSANRVEFTLSPATAEEIRFIQLVMDTGKITVGGGQRRQ